MKGTCGIVNGLRDLCLEAGVESRICWDLEALAQLLVVYRRSGGIQKSGDAECNYLIYDKHKTEDEQGSQDRDQR